MLKMMILMATISDVSCLTDALSQFLVRRFAIIVNRILWRI